MNVRSAIVVAALCCSAIFLNSCVYERPAVYGGGTYYSGAAAAWTDASYDANGFPIFGYYYGRPVYGYTANGAAIFAFAALTAACLVPLWAPAPWYHGHWHYPRHIHRVSAPPHCPHGHFPARRPHGGLDAPIHKNPQQVLHGHQQHREMNRAPQMQMHNNRHDANRAPQMQMHADRHDANRAPQMQMHADRHDANRAPQMQMHADRHDANRAPQMPVGNHNSAAPVRRPDILLPGDHGSRAAGAAAQPSVMSHPMSVPAARHNAPASSAPAFAGNPGGHAAHGGHHRR